MAEPAFLLDVRGTLCPMPVIKTHRAMRRVNPGETLHVVADDKTSLLDLPTWCRNTGHLLLEKREEAHECHFVIQRRDRHQEATAPP